MKKFYLEKPNKKHQKEAIEYINEFINTNINLSMY